MPASDIARVFQFLPKRFVNWNVKSTDLLLLLDDERSGRLTDPKLPFKEGKATQPYDSARPRIRCPRRLARQSYPTEKDS